MSNIQKDKKDALGYIDTAITILEKYPNLENINLNVTASPFAFLIDICKSLGCYEQLLQWLVNFLTTTLPAVELGVKGILLTNIKQTISCSTDPRIPNYMRKENNGGDENYTKGIFLNLESLDPYYLMTVSPLSDEGKTLYFGTEGVRNIYQLARAKDFNAFMWFCIHKGFFPFPRKINDVIFTDSNLLGLTTIKSNNNSTNILVGNTFIKEENSKIINLTINAKRDENGAIIENTLVPFSSDNNSANWYVDSGTFYDFLKPENKRKARNYADERAICNLRFYNRIPSGVSGLNNTQNKLQFTILPKPFVHLPRNGEPPWRIQPILFNDKGKQDKNGKYSILVENEPITNNDTSVRYNGLNGGTLTINKSDGSYKLDIDPNNLPLALYECYSGLTVYKFNYDFVMGMQLFDAKVITTQLINNLLGIEVGVNLNYSKRQIEGRRRIAEVVKNIIESDAYEVSDCYFTFSNEKYDEMIRNAELKHLKQEPFENGVNSTATIKTDEILNILNDYDAINGTLEENKDVITRAIQQTSATIVEGIDPSEKYQLNVDIITNLVQNLVNAIVDSLLSPKILLLFEINKRLMGDTNEALSFDDLLKLMMNVIVSIIKEVRDLILKELLEFVLEQLRPIFELLSDKLLIEQATHYRQLLSLLLKECKFSKRKKSEIATELDEVDYADIDTIEQPKTSDC